MSGVGAWTAAASIQQPLPSVPGQADTRTPCPPSCCGRVTVQPHVYSLLTNTMYSPLRNAYARIMATPPREDDLGARLYSLTVRNQFAPGFEELGTVRAISVETGETVWQHDQRAMTMFLVATSGGLVFGGPPQPRRPVDDEQQHPVRRQAARHQVTQQAAGDGRRLGGPSRRPSTCLRPCVSIPKATTMQWSRKTLPSMQTTRRSSSPNGCKASDQRTVPSAPARLPRAPLLARVPLQAVIVRQSESHGFRSGPRRVRSGCTVELADHPRCELVIVSRPEVPARIRPLATPTDTRPRGARYRYLDRLHLSPLTDSIRAEAELPRPRLAPFADDQDTRR